MVHTRSYEVSIESTDCQELVKNLTVVTEMKFGVNSSA